MKNQEMFTCHLHIMSKLNKSYSFLQSYSRVGYISHRSVTKEDQNQATVSENANKENQCKNCGHYVRRQTLLVGLIMRCGHVGFESLVDVKTPEISQKGFVEHILYIWQFVRQNTAVNHSENLVFFHIFFHLVKKGFHFVLSKSPKRRRFN